MVGLAGSAVRQFGWLLLVLATAARAEVLEDFQQQLNCTASKVAGVYRLCQASGELEAKKNVTYLMKIDESDATNHRYDLNITLSPTSGDADLMVRFVPKEGPTNESVYRSSVFNIGDDIVFIGRDALVAGTLEVTVLGYTPHSAFSLAVEAVTAQRELRPIATLALGQFFLECCKMEGSCSTIKMDPRLQDDNPDTNPNYCYMDGLLCSMDGYLLEMNLQNQDLVCELPIPLLHRLPHLRRLTLFGNQITGNITEVALGLGTMTELEFLDLSATMLAGELDTACGLAGTDRLRQLNLAQNALSGEIPACLLGMSAIQELHLDQNLLQGPVPAIPSSTPLVYFTAAEQMGGFTGGGLSGPLPDNLAAFPALTFLDLSGNMLTGTLPSRLPPTLIDFRVSYNFLTGTIPSSFGENGSLKTLEMGNNQLIGSLPAALARNKIMKLLDVQSNHLEGNIPDDWSHATRLVYLTLQNNRFTGELPASLASHPSLTMLDVSWNQLEGTLDQFQAAIPSIDSDQPSALWMLNLANNSFTGDLNKAEGLARLGLFQSHELPHFAQHDATINFMPRVIDLSHNGFGGEFPLWLVRQLASTNESIIVDLTGAALICPKSGFGLYSEALPEALGGLHCYEEADPLDVDLFSSPMKNVTSLTYILAHHSRAPIIAVALIGCASLLLALIAGATYAYTRLRNNRISPASANKFHAFQDALPEGKPYPDPEWDARYRWSWEPRQALSWRRCPINPSPANDPLRDRSKALPSPSHGLPCDRVTESTSWMQPASCWLRR